jgi:SAM-dependent methyltransferase
MPALLPGARIAGSDFNARSIEWCRRALSGIEFRENSLHPPLPYPEASLDAAYAVSVFTHLSSDLQARFFAELMRIVKPGGVVLFTTHGSHAARKLRPAETAAFARGEPVVRGGVKEGKRGFVSYHPPAFVQGLVGAREVLEHRPGPVPRVTSQDVWVVRC